MSCADWRSPIRGRVSPSPARSARASTGRLAPTAGRLERARQALGSEFAANCLTIDAEREGVRLNGFAGLPTFSKANALTQYFYVNGRAVRDKLLAGALRAAYLD